MGSTLASGACGDFTTLSATGPGTDRVATGKIGAGRSREPSIKKAIVLSSEGSVQSNQVIDGARGEGSIRHRCLVLGLARSSHYAKRKPKQPRVIESCLEMKIRALHIEHREALKARGLSKELRTEGIFIGRHRMRSLIKTLDLAMRRPRYAHYRRATKT